MVPMDGMSYLQTMNHVVKRWYLWMECLIYKTMNHVVKRWYLWMECLIYKQ